LNASTRILSSKINSILPFASEIKIGDYIELTMEGSTINGIYKIISLGSENDSPWILERV
jgi:hypothetical protein